MTVPVAVGVAGLVEATVGYMITSLISGGSSSWNPFDPPSNVNSGQQEQALRIARKTVAKLANELQTQNWIEIVTTAAGQEASWDAVLALQTLADHTIPAVRGYAGYRAYEARLRAQHYSDARLEKARLNLVNRIQAVHTDLGQLITDLTNATTTRENSLSDRIHALRTDLSGAVNTAVNDAAAYTNQVRTKIEADLTALQAAMQTYADADAARARAYADTVGSSTLTKADAYTDAQIGQLITKENGDLTRNLAQVWPEFQTQVQALQQMLTTDDPAAANDLQTIPVSEPASNPAAAFAAITAVTALLRTANRCTVPNCRNLSELGRILADLFAGASALALIAMLTEIVTNPDGAADETMGIVSGLVRDSIGTVSGWIGL